MLTDAEAALLPTELVARTLHEYIVFVVNPETVSGLAAPLTVCVAVPAVHEAL